MGFLKLLAIFTVLVVVFRLFKPSKKLFVEFVTVTSAVFLYFAYFEILKNGVIHFILLIASIPVFYIIVRYAKYKKTLLIFLSTIIFAKHLSEYSTKIPVLIFIYAKLLLSAIEMTAEGGKKINFTEFAAYILFFPSSNAGPVHMLNHFENIENPEPVNISKHKYDLQRIVWGTLKLKVFSLSLKPLIPSEFLFDGFVHGPFEITITLVAFYLFIYFNISGAADVVIGASKIIGYNLPENFDRPFKSLNLSDFWLRWNITIGNFLRTTLFFPVQKMFMLRFPAHKLFFSVVTLSLTMIAMGVWTGIKINLLLHGTINAVGLSIHFLYKQAALKRFPDVYAKLSRNTIYKCCAWFATHAFICFTLLFFDLDIDRLMYLFKMLTGD